jgi:hypothetical protein
MTYRFACALMAGMALPMLAAPAFAGKLYGAISFSPSTEAVNQCGVGDCEAVVIFPSCGAIAVGDGFGMGFSADKSIAKSEETALANCNQYTTNCLVTTSLCNGGS